MRKDAPDRDNAEWARYQELVLAKMRECEGFQDEQTKINSDLEKRITDAHGEIRWLRDRIVLLTSGIGTGVGIIWGMISDHWEKLFK